MFPLPLEVLPERLYVGIGKAAEADVAVSARLHSYLLGFGGKRVPQEHPNYLYRQTHRRLTVNFVDGPARLFDWAGVPMWHRIFEFMDGAYDQGKPMSVRCDKGLSRSACVAAAWMATRCMVSPHNFTDALDEFRWSYYPNATPSTGIFEWVSSHWGELLAYATPNRSTDNAPVNITTDRGDNNG